MESITAANFKYFLFSNSLISDHQSGFCPGHSTLDMLLLPSLSNGLVLESQKIGQEHLLRLVTDLIWNA